MNRIETFVSNKNYILLLFVLFALAASVQSLLHGPIHYSDGEMHYSHYNNYTIFERSFYHLKGGQDLYIEYPNEQWDLYKYTPTFSVFFGVFAVFPDWLGLCLWNLLNALFLVLAVYYLPKLDNYKKGVLLLLVLIELITSMQNAQSNGLIAGLLILSFGLLENKKYLWAVLCIVFSAYIKIFGIVGFALFLFYPQKWKLALYTLGWSVVLFLIPLVFIDYHQYIKLFESYKLMLDADHSASLGYSVMGWLHSWFGLELNKNAIVLGGALIFMVPYAFLSRYSDYTFKLLALTSVLLWIVIFNHKAESPTFIIAMAGVALWFVVSEKTKLNIALMALAFIFTSLSATDIFPKFVRVDYFMPYSVKAVPCILVWVKVVWEMVRMRRAVGG